jgi:hypothetical protein
MLPGMPSAPPQSAAPRPPAPVSRGPVPAAPQVTPVQIEAQVKEVLTNLRDELADQNINWKRIFDDVFGQTNKPTSPPPLP